MPSKPAARQARLWALIGGLGILVNALGLIFAGIVTHETTLWVSGLLLAGPALLLQIIVYLLRPESNGTVHGWRR